jgi:hypothetical protein
MPLSHHHNQYLFRRCSELRPHKTFEWEQLTESRFEQTEMALAIQKVQLSGIRMERLLVTLMVRPSATLMGPAWAI